MRFFDKLTGGGVDWMVELASQTGAFRPGDAVTGVVRYVPKANMQVRSINVALVGVEQYMQLVRSSGSRVGSSSSARRSEWDREWFSEEVHRQALPSSGPQALQGQVPGQIPFQFQIPSDALPSFDSPVLRMRWQIQASMDVGGRDPNTERDLYVVGGANVVAAAPDAAFAVAPSVQDPQSGATIYVEPTPLVAGQQFRGYLETAEPLDLGNVRVELKQHVATTGGSGGGLLNNTTLNMGNLSLGLGSSHRNVGDDRVLWAGQLTPMGAGPAGQRYQFWGQLQPAPVGTVVLPHGSSTTMIDVTVSRRLQADRHFLRPVAIVTG